MTRPRKKLLLAFAAFIALIATFLVIEHFRGEWALKRWKARMLAQGEELNIDKLAPPLPPADENGFQPLLFAAGQLGSLPPDLQPPASKYTAPGKCIVITALNEWHTRNSRTNENITWAKAAEPLALAEPHIQAALNALESEAFNANIYYRGGFNIAVMHLTRIKSLAQFLSAAALQDLHQGQNDAAFAKLRGLLALANVQRDEPSVISQLVRIAVMHIAFATTWQALQCGGWSDDQLAELQRSWNGYDFVHAMDRALAMERAMGRREYESFRESGLPLSGMLNPGAALPTPSLLSWDWLKEIFDVRATVVAPIWRFAWSTQDELYYCETIQSMLEAQRSELPSKNGVAALAKTDQTEAKSMLGPYGQVRFMMARLIIPALAKAFRRPWLAETTCEITSTAIALKRYELRHGKVPCSLQTLVPEFLAQVPIDYMDGQPLRYCRDSDTEFVLYSVGPDGRDSHGDSTPTPNATSSNWNYQNGRDLVWPRPASEPEIAIWRIQRR